MQDFADVEAELGGAEQEAAPSEPETSPADDSEVVDDGPPDYKALLEQLERAKKARDREAGEKGSLKQQYEKLQKELDELKAGRSGESAQEQGWQPLKASRDQVENFWRQHDPDWESNQHDDFVRKTYEVAYDVGLNVAQGAIGEIQALKEQLANMQFGSRLQEYGLDRGTFDGIVAEFPSLQKLSFDEQLEMISRMGRSFGSGGQPSPAQGAPTTQRRPRIESPMGGGSAGDPRAKSLRDLQAAHDSGDLNKARALATPLWDQFKADNGLR